MYYQVLIIPILMSIVSSIPLLGLYDKDKSSTLALWGLFCVMVVGLCALNIRVLLFFIHNPHSSINLFPFKPLIFEYIYISWHMSLNLQVMAALNLFSAIYFLVVLMTLGYFKHEPVWLLNRVLFYFSWTLFFVNLLLTFDNFIINFIAWSGLSVVNGLAIWSARRENTLKQAFLSYLIMCVGDLCFLLALIISLSVFYSTDLHSLIHQTFPGVQDTYVHRHNYILLVKVLFFVSFCSKAAQGIYASNLPKVHECIPAPLSVLLQIVVLSGCGFFMIFKLLFWLATTPSLMPALAWVGLFTMVWSLISSFATRKLRIILSYIISFHLGAVLVSVGLGLQELSILYIFMVLLGGALLLMVVSIILSGGCGDEKLYSIGGLFPNHKVMFFVLLTLLLLLTAMSILLLYQVLMLYNISQLFRVTLEISWFGLGLTCTRLLLVGFFRRPYESGLLYKDQFNKPLYVALSMGGICLIATCSALALYMKIQHMLYVNLILDSEERAAILLRVGSLMLMAFAVGYLLFYKTIPLLPRYVLLKLDKAYSYIEHKGYAEDYRLFKAFVWLKNTTLKVSRSFSYGLLSKLLTPERLTYVVRMIYLKVRKLDYNNEIFLVVITIFTLIVLFIRVLIL